MKVKKLVKLLEQDKLNAERRLDALNEEYHECTWEGDRAEIEGEMLYYEDKVSIIKNILEYIEEGQ